MAVKKQPAPLPTALVVGPYTFTIQSDGVAFLAAEEAEGERLLGRTNFLSLVIDVRPGAQGDVTRETLLHEVLHTQFYGTKTVSDKEEEIVQRLAPLLLDTLRRNPELVRFLLDA